MEAQEERVDRAAHLRERRRVRRAAIEVASQLGKSIVGNSMQLRCAKSEAEVRGLELLQQLQLSLQRMPFYAVAIGERPGIYNTWPEAERLVKGYPNARYKKFHSRDEAQQFIVTHTGGGVGSMGRKREREEEPGVAPRHASSRPHSSITTSTLPHPRNRSPPMKPHQRPGAFVCFTDGSCLGNGKSCARGGM